MRPAPSAGVWTPAASPSARTALTAWCVAAVVIAGHGPPLAGAGGRVAVEAVATIGTTVSDLARSTRFFVDVLGFTVEGREPVELSGRPFELLHGLFGARARVAVLRLGG